MFSFKKGMAQKKTVFEALELMVIVFYLLKIVVLLKKGITKERNVEAM